MTVDRPVQFHCDVSVYHVARVDHGKLRVCGTVWKYWVIDYVLDGEVVMDSAGYTFVARSGDIMIHPPFVPYSEFADGVGVRLTLHVDCRVLNHMDLLHVYPVYPVFQLDYPGVLRRFEDLLDVWSSPPSRVRELLLTTQVMELLTLVVHRWEQQGIPERPESFRTNYDKFKELISYMTERLDQPLSRKDIASRAHMHPNYLDRIFRQTMGQTPTQMFRNLRLIKAQCLLVTENWPMEKVAEMCGFPDVSDFSHVFNRSLGMPPSVYRKKYKYYN